MNLHYLKMLKLNNDTMPLKLLNLFKGLSIILHSEPHNISNDYLLCKKSFLKHVIGICIMKKTSGKQF